MLAGVICWDIEAELETASFAEGSSFAYKLVQAVIVMSECQSVKQVME